MALLAFGAIPVKPVAGAAAACALFLGAYVSTGERSLAASIGYPIGLLLALFLEPLFPVSELGAKTIELAAYASLIGLLGSAVGSLVNRRSVLHSAVEAVAYSLIFALAFLSALYLGYILVASCQLLLPRGWAIPAVVFSCCVAGGFAGAFVGTCMGFLRSGPGRLRETLATR
jgi:CDP-diglyceride synthetase